MSQRPIATRHTTWKEFPIDGYGGGAMSLWVSVPIIATPRSRSHGQHAAWSAGEPAWSGLTAPSTRRRP